MRPFSSAADRPRAELWGLLPPKREMLYVFAVCVFPVNLWSMLNLLQQIPAWRLRLGAWDLIGAVAYSQSFALVEICILFLMLVVLAVLLPGRLLRDKFLSVGSLFVLFAAAWTVVMHRVTDCCDAFSIWGAGDIALLLLGYVLCFVLVQVLVRFDASADRAVRGLVERIAVLSVFYLAVDVISVGVVLVRNV